MNHTSITVLMTVRNGEPYISDAVSSILNQTYVGFRFLIVDNASIDNSVATIKSLHDSRIDIVELKENIGQTAALNHALEMIDTPWVARMDADDISLPSRLELQMAYIGSNPDVTLLGTGVQWINSDDRIFKNSKIVVNDSDIRWMHLTGYGAFAHSSVMFSTEAARQAGGYPIDYTYAQDYALWCRMLEIGKAANIPQQLVHLRQHDSNTTNSEKAELEVITIIKSQLSKVLPYHQPTILEEVAQALRYNTETPISSEAIECLSSLPSTFRDFHGVEPSKQLEREYVGHWLYMARVTSLEDKQKAFIWFNIASRIDRQNFLRWKMTWHTLASIFFAPLRRLKSRYISKTN